MTKKVLIITYNLSMGGLQRSSCILANQFTKNHVKVYFYCVTKAEHFFLLDESIELFEPKDQVRLFSGAFLKHLFRLRNNIKNCNPDTILVFGKFLGAFTMFATLGVSTRVVITERMSPTHKDKAYIKVFMRFAYLLKKPDGIIAQTKIAESFQREYFCSKVPIKVIPNAIRSVKHFPDVLRKKFILGVGRTHDHLKGFDRLLNAFAKIKNQDWQLVLAGGDPDGGLLKKLTQNLGLTERVLFLGKLKDIDHVYAEAGIFVIPSRSEGFPNSLCEAMAAGLPCISFNFISGPQDIITDGEDGIIVEDGDITGMTSKIDFLIENESERKRLGTNAMKNSERFSEEKIWRDYLNFLLQK